MARTHRDKLNHQRRAKRRSWSIEDLRPGLDFDYSDSINRYPRLRGGNMLMAERVCGVWGDERDPSGTSWGGRHRDAARRSVKRSERQRWRREALRDLAAEEAETLAEYDDCMAEVLSEQIWRDYCDDWFIEDLDEWFDAAPMKRRLVRV